MTATMLRIPWMFRWPWLRSASLAVYDLGYDRWSSLGTILAISAVVAPVLLLRGLELGAVGSMRAALEQDPRSREVLVTGSGNFGPDILRRIRTHPDTGFLLAKPRYLNSALPVRRVSGEGELVELEIEPTAPGDPLLEGVTLPRGYATIVLSRRAGERLEVTPGDVVRMTLRRRTAAGDWEARRAELRVLEVLPEERDYEVRGYVSSDFARAIELWREGSIDAHGSGILPSPNLLPETPTARIRLYARSLEGAPRLRAFLEQLGIEARLRDERVATLLRLAERLDRLLAALALLATIGLAAMFAVSGWHRAHLRLRELAVLRLLGFSGVEMGLFPLVQVALLAAAGVFLGTVLAFISGPLLEGLLRQSLGLQRGAFHLPLIELLAALAGGTMIGAFAACGAAWRAARIEPAEVLHDG